MVRGHEWHWEWPLRHRGGRNLTIFADLVIQRVGVGGGDGNDIAGLAGAMRDEHCVDGIEPIGSVPSVNEIVR
jgi:hypothetical protein